MKTLAYLMAVAAIGNFLLFCIYTYRVASGLPIEHTEVGIVIDKLIIAALFGGLGLDYLRRL